LPLNPVLDGPHGNALVKAESFGYKNAWIAVRSTDSNAVATALQLRNARASDWEEGIAAAYKYPIGNSVFVTPPIDGWILCVGYPLFAAVDARPPSFGEEAGKLASLLGCEVQYFSTHRVVSAHAWARARPSGLERAYSYVGESGEKTLDLGVPSPEERALAFAFFDPTSPEAQQDSYWDREDLKYPDEEHVMALAGAWSIDPSALEGRNLETVAGLLGDYGPEVSQPPVVPKGKPWWHLW
jgi:hypothetical protein